MIGALGRGLLVLVAAVSWLPEATAGTRSQTPEAVAARDRAEKAVSEERWCDAAHEFLRAYELSSPTVREALLNAGVAARRAGDLEFAASLYERFVSSHPVHRHRSTAERLAGELREEIERDGPGASCPPAPPIEPGGLIVRADAAGAVVYVDDDRVGEAPARVSPSSFDPVIVRVEAPGRIPFVSSVTPTFQDLVVDAELRRLPVVVEGREETGLDDEAAIPPRPTVDPEDEGTEVALVRDPDALRPPGDAPPPARRPVIAPPDRSRRMATVGWMLLGAGGGLAGGGGGFLLSAGSAADQLSSHLPPAGTLPERDFDSELQGLEDRYRLHRDLGHAGLVGGGVVAAVGLVLVVIDGAR